MRYLKAALAAWTLAICLAFAGVSWGYWIDEDTWVPGGPKPFVYAPLTSNLTAKGLDAATFTRASTATYVDPADGLIKTAAIDTPRFEANGLLMEGQGTNICLRSEEFGNAAWQNQFLGLISDSSISPNGSQTAEHMTGPFPHDNSAHNQLVSATAQSKKYTFSVWLKGTGTISIGLSNAVDDVSRISITLSSTWTRFSITKTFNATVSSSVRVEIIDIPTSTVSDLYAWGAQLEESPIMTSYIPTAESTVTRAADSLSYPLSDALKDILSNAVGDGVATGTAVLTWKPSFVSGNLAAQNFGMLSPSNAMNNLIYYANSNFIQGYDSTNNPTAALTWASGTEYMLAVRWSSVTNQYQVSVKSGGTWSNGVATEFDGAFALGTVLNLAYNSVATTTLPSHYRGAKFYRKWLSDSELSRLK